VIDGDAGLGQQFLNVSVGQSVVQVSADRDRDHLGRKPEASKTEDEPDEVTTPVSCHPRSTNATVPPLRLCEVVTSIRL